MRSCQAPPISLKIWLEVQPLPLFPAERGDAHYVYRTDISHRHVTIKQIIPNKLLLNHFTHESKNLSQKNRRKAFIAWISSSEPLIASVFFKKKCIKYCRCLKRYNTSKIPEPSVRNSNMIFNDILSQGRPGAYLIL